MKRLLALNANYVKLFTWFTESVTLFTGRRSEAVEYE